MEGHLRVGFQSGVDGDPRTACFYARRALELAVAWAYKYDRALKLPYNDNVSALIHEPTFKQTAGDAVFNKAKVIVTLGNRAVHTSRSIPESDSRQAVKELFHFCYWFARLYGRRERPAGGLAFDEAALPKTTPMPTQTLDQLKRFESQLQDKDEKLSIVLADKGKLDGEIQRLRAEVAQAKKVAAAIPDDHDYSEAQTRDYFIDLLLKEAGWPLDQKRDRESEDAKRFDLLVLNLQLALLNTEPFYERLQEQVMAIAGLLEEKSSIPMVQKQMTYIQDVQTEQWWENVNVPMLEVIRRRLRDLVQFIEKRKRQPVYTDFEDLLGDETDVAFPQFASQDTFERFRSKAQAFLREHFDIEAVRKLWMSEPLTTQDLTDLEGILNDNQIGNPEFFEQAKQECESFGISARSLVGLDREVAKKLFGEFLQGSEYNANQIEFINMIINQLVDHGIVDVSILYESPFTDVSPQGPDAIFSADQMKR